MAVQSPLLPRLGASFWTTAAIGGLVLVSGAALTWVGLAGLRQELAVAERRDRDDSERAADRVVGSLDSTLRAWLEAVAAIPDASPTAARDGLESLERWPQPLRAALADGCAVALDVYGGVAVQRPPHQLPFELSAPAGTGESKPPPALELAERLELRDQNYPAALAEYRQLVATGAADLRIDAQLRIGRTLAKAGRPREALDAYTALARNADTRSPAVAMAFYNRCDLLAQLGQIGELNQCALTFFSGLAKARWRLDEARYTYYVERAEAWLPGAGADAALDDLRSTVRARRALADAAKAGLAAARAFDATQTPAVQLLPSVQGAGVTFALLRHDDGLRLFVMTEPCARRHLWQKVVEAAEPGFEASLAGPGGVRLAGNGNVAGGTPAEVRAERSVESHGRTWRVQAQPTDRAGRSAAAARRQRVYYTLLLVVLGSLGASGYFAIRTVRKELEIARMKSEFVSAVSHEFRSPLTAIRHLSELLHTGRIAEGVKPAEYFELIFKESQRLTRLVENLLDFARIEEGRHEFRFERVPTASWLRTTVDAFIAASVGAVTRIEVAVCGPVTDIHADASALARALHNLLDNAVKYSADPAMVRVSATMTGGVVAIAVSDRGIGIAPEQHRAVFDRFHRAPNALDRPGTGLGLALVQRIVEAHGGTVTIDSGLGQGTTVTLTLPACESE